MTEWLKIYRRQDWILLGAALGLCTLGILFIFSATYQGPGVPMPRVWMKQALWLGIALVGYLLMIQVNPTWLIRMGPILYAIGVVLLVLVALVGTELNEGRRWLRLGPFILQPSEFVKISNLVLLAYLLGEVDVRPPNLARVFSCLFWVGIPLVLVILQPDLGTALVFLPSALGLLFLAGMRWRHLFLLASMAFLAVLPILFQLVHYFRFFYPQLQLNPGLNAPWWYLFKPYQCNRILVFLDPNFDPYNAGWNLLQCKIAVGSGGYAGKGFLQGSQNLLGFLPRPVAPTDFIFSVLAEELGFRGVLLLVGLYLVLLTRLIMIGLRCRQEPSRSLLAGGIAIIFFCHIFVNLGMTIGLMPITGLPLPLMSYGGSFLLGSMLALGMVQAVFVRRGP